MSDIIDNFRQQLNDDFDSLYLIHGNNILAKILDNRKLDVLKKIIPEYDAFKILNNKGPLLFLAFAKM